MRGKRNVERQQQAFLVASVPFAAHPTVGRLEPRRLQASVERERPSVMPHAHLGPVFAHLPAHYRGCVRVGYPVLEDHVGAAERAEPQVHVHQRPRADPVPVVHRQGAVPPVRPGRPGQRVVALGHIFRPGVQKLGVPVPRQ